MSTKHDKELSTEWLFNAVGALAAFRKWLQANPENVTTDDLDKFLELYRIEPSEIAEL